MTIKKMFSRRQPIEIDVTERYANKSNELRRLAICSRRFQKAIHVQLLVGVGTKSKMHFTAMSRRFDYKIVT